MVVSASTALPVLAEELAAITPLRDPTADEQVVYEALHRRRDFAPGELATVLRRILDAMEARDDYTGMAMLRESVRSFR